MTSFASRAPGRLIQDVLLTCGLSLLLLVLSYMRLWGDSQSAALNTRTLDPGLVQVWGTALGENLLKFAVAQMVLHIAAGLLCLGMAYASYSAWRSTAASPRQWLLLWFIVMAAWLLLANATWFPISSMGRTYAQFAGSNWLGIRPLDVLSFLCAAAVAPTLLRVLLRVDLRKLRRVAAATLAMLLVTWLAGSVALPNKSNTAPGRPNVILLGMDSLRVDALGQGRTPAVDAFLGRSVVFSDTLTPTARTFPSWVSILTGRHPHSTGATTNLMPRHMIGEIRTLPNLLGSAGYASLYAMDEVRFSNIDGSFGFDQVVTTPMGASEFLLAFFCDTPLSNLLVSTPIGRLLFPHAYANRGFALTYEPDTFIDSIDAQLQPDDRPQLVVTHLTLTHMPYLWKGQQSVPREADGTPSNRKAYELAVARLDRQFSDFIEMIRRKGLLENAIVVVLSDHGESLGESCPQMVPETLVTKECQDFGHGYNLLATSQYQVVLGVRAFGRAASSLGLQPRQVSLPASLEDVTPTLMDLLGLPSVPNFDGRSLAAAVRAEPAAEVPFEHRVRFVETEFNPRGFNGAEMTREGMRHASGFYHVDPVTDRVSLREQYMPRINLNRQRGAWLDGRLLFAMPIVTSSSFRLIYLVPGATARQILSREELQSDVVAARLWADLQRRFPDLTTSVTFESSQTHEQPSGQHQFAAGTKAAEQR